LVLGGLLGLGVEDVGVAQVRAELLGDHGPAHQLGDGKELHQTGFLGDLRQSRVLLDAVQEIRLLIIVRGKNNIVDNAGE
jgi:hypothetical protein